MIPAGQPLYLYYELYDAATDQAGQRPAPQGPSSRQARGPPAQGAVRVLSSVAFYRGARKVFETALVETSAVTASDRKATAFRLDVPTADLAPGLYTCQVNLIDDVAGTFAFPRLAVYIRR